MSPRLYKISLAVAYALGVCALFSQAVFAIMSPAYQGLQPYRGADESIYLIHLQEGLIDMTADTTNGIWSGAHDTTGMQSALMERVAGWMFGWTGFDSTIIALFLTAFVGPTVILLMAALLRRAGVSRRMSVFIAFAFFIDMGLVRRFFNPSISMPLSLLTLLLIWRWWEHLRWRDALGAGVMLGLLTGVYFWSWTYAWAMYGILLLFVIDRWRQPDFKVRALQYITGGIAALIAGAPSLWKTYTNAHHPLFPESSLRMGLLYTREFESIPRSICLVLLAFGTFWALRKRADRLRYAPAIAMAIAAFAVMHQQFVHGRIMSFSSHYYFYVCIAATVAMGVFIARRKVQVLPVIVCMVTVLLLGGAWLDYKGRLIIMGPPDQRSMRMQHLAPIVKDLKWGERETILSDRHTSNQLASLTNDDVVFTDYCRILLVSNQEYIERYCLSEAFSTNPIDTEFIPDANRELSLAGRTMTEFHTARMREMTEAICPLVNADIASYLKKYEADSVLWNEKEKPDWDMNQPYLQLRQKGDGWSMYDVIQ